MRPALLFVIACCAATLHIAAAEAIPSSHAETLTGQKLEFPAALLGKLPGKPAVCVFGFSKSAGDLTKVWMTRLNEDGVNVWSVADLEKAPSLVRGMIRSSMRKGTPQALLDHSLILTKDTDLWERAVGAAGESLPVVVLFDASGQIVWKYQGAFGDEKYRELKERLATQGSKPL